MFVLNKEEKKALYEKRPTIVKRMNSEICVDPKLIRIRKRFEIIRNEEHLIKLSKKIVFLDTPPKQTILNKSNRFDKIISHIEGEYLSVLFKDKMNIYNNAVRKKDFKKVQKISKKYNVNLGMLHDFEDSTETLDENLDKILHRLVDLRLKDKKSV